MTDVRPRTPSMRLDGKRAIVTGAGRGLGRAAATALAEAGAHVALAARSTDEIDALAEGLNSSGLSAEAVPLDVTDLGAVEAAFARHEPFHILVNNAGTNRPKPMWDVGVDDYDLVMGLNVRSAYFVARACARKLIEERQAGSLIHMGSQMGHVGGQNRSLYCASKWAIEGMSKAFALDLAPYNIRSNVIAPTFVETPLTKPFLEDARFRESVLRKIKLGRVGQPEDVMGAVVFLAGDASALMTGSSMLIDGGWTAD